MHDDDVSAVPPGCALLRASARGPFQGSVRFYTPCSPPAPPMTTPSPPISRTMCTPPSMRARCQPTPDPAADDA
ncbi:hypothetical protein HYPSUDRAFT_322722 [Hypholoma sublateritium FD-334 SS-4]|uniref:Uncharacterized protein n=1 Tax=Hypholoma sublateritium (strain FD-334 SS-4) TaxID=945553 RepID=A0A0D2LZ43_HYPSF|nr:hypothetical protein HYPSUDRAFT_322722 [Hypholoma sublateritium FD-334 SS-4]